MVKPVPFFLGFAAVVLATRLFFAPVTVKLTPQVGFAPTTLNIAVKAEPKETNRGLTLIIESENYYRSSFDSDYVYDEKLGGTPLQSTYQYELRAPGHYTVTAILHRTLPDKDVRGYQTACFSGGDVEC